MKPFILSIGLLLSALQASAQDCPLNVQMDIQAVSMPSEETSSSEFQSLWQGTQNAQFNYAGYDNKIGCEYENADKSVFLDISPSGRISAYLSDTFRVKPQNTFDTVTRYWFEVQSSNSGAFVGLRTLSGYCSHGNMCGTILLDNSPQWKISKYRIVVKSLSGQKVLEKK